VALFAAGCVTPPSRTSASLECPANEISALGGSQVDQESNVASDPRDMRRAVVTWTERPPDSNSAASTIDAAVTLDGGATWTATTPLHDPAVSPASGGKLYGFDSRAAVARDGTFLVLFGGEDHVTPTGASDATVYQDNRMTLASTRDGHSWTYHSVPLASNGVTVDDAPTLLTFPDSDEVLKTAAIIP
jgi:hypothetical protein